MNKKYKCRFLNHGLFISFDHFRHCHLCVHAPDSRCSNRIVDYNGPKDKIDWNLIFETKEKLAKQMEIGNFPDFCKGCSWIEEIEEQNFIEDNKRYIDIVWIAHFNHCNSKCTYCYINEQDFLSKGYDLVPLFKTMFEKDLYDIENGDISFGFGEPTLLPAFDKLIKLLKKNGIKKFAIYTNGIKYSNTIGDALASSDTEMYIVVSMDSGTRETYKKIKKVDKFNDVCKNIKKYVQKATKYRADQFEVKFIIVPGINDTIDEVKSWYDLCVNKLGVKALSFDIEEHWYIENKDNIPAHIYDLCKYVKNQSEIDKIKFKFFDRAALLDIESFSYS